jgi:hypothetical protein
MISETGVIKEFLGAIKEFSGVINEFSGVSHEGVLRFQSLRSSQVSVVSIKLVVTS